MDEYISREAIIEELEEEIEAGDEYEYEEDVLINKGLKIALKDIKRLPAADVQPIDRWIRCDEELPEESKYVLIYYNTWSGNHIAIARLTNYVFAFNNSGQSITMDRVTHWQPLPESPKDGDTND